MNLKLNDRTPKYQQIITFIRDKISNGEWPIGSKIPSQRQLAKLLNVNRSTVITALEELAADGLIEGKMGKGTIVINNTWSLLAATSLPNWNDNVPLGIYEPSKTTVQEINATESNSSLIQLSKGELSPELFPLQTMRDVMRRASEKMSSFGYEEPKGSLHLREAISNYLLTIGIKASPASILIVSGALQALQLISIGLLKIGSTILLEKPSYLYSLHLFQSAGMKLTGVSLDQSDFFTRKSKREQAILYTIPCFHNPTGRLLSSQHRQEILKLCEKEQLPMIEDDIYRELWIDEKPPLPLKAFDSSGHVLFVDSLSKTLSPGLRIGWIVGSEPVIERLADIKMQTDYGSSSISQSVAFEWLDSGLYEKHLVYVREQLKVRRGIVLFALETYLSDIACWEIPSGGLFVWIQIKPKISMRDLFMKARANGLLINPGHIYGEDSGRYLRLSYAYAPILELKQGIQQLSQLIKQLIKK
ncbi:PLP-dependent aminotransferase family protein [Bacillus aquiflavi]|uniref:aminotransferase-like domain-containing protein n=1 Tax=Bacillus aquiflavi TaxID=2672567 RepID=UPI001CA86F60|nr:PLP-dependent aminotransferase family protein [Bacillus aquiflavi]UAC49533.1 PLP-dependent aminotransferase family protein [Bacillus aquiflavi]